LVCLALVSYWLMFLLIGFLFYPIVWIYGMVDANKKAQRINTQMLSQSSVGLRDQLTEGA
jgi:hypothetical protein